MQAASRVAGTVDLTGSLRQVQFSSRLGWRCRSPVNAAHPGGCRDLRPSRCLDHRTTVPSGMSSEATSSIDAKARTVCLRPTCRVHVGTLPANAGDMTVQRSVQCLETTSGRARARSLEESIQSVTTDKDVASAPNGCNSVDATGLRNICCRIAQMQLRERTTCLSTAFFAWRRAAG